MAEERDRPVQTASQLLPQIYDRVRLIAHDLMAREGGGHSLQATALVHEAYLRLRKGERQPDWANPSHLSAVLVEAMRRILVESARRKKRLKRGGGRTRLDADLGQFEAASETDELLVMDEALRLLAKENENWAHLVQLRFFLGLTVPEAAEAMGVSTRTAEAWWTVAREWMKQRLAIDVDDGDGVPPRK